ncbi:putative lipoprotein [[Actinomadura] parvosata subsp. kistnae]|uniref:DUF305 domain-containing protein n=1 Tax=[Actinomadura] parvosata subsp. kistnae TaxID=1909395 RepID=A0A1V0AF51_9ACTN|nr:hypothetical protein BKM31_51710 [Nonomuraea sp. ATCC 55076]SPL92654.1 putative lipoprotein [Actinomadura parvosata subsp. kistnae]
MVVLVLRWLLGLSLLVAALAGCSAEGQGQGVAHGGVIVTSTGAPAFNPTDVAWLQLTDALHTRAEPLLELAADRAAGRSLRALAVRLGKAREAGRERLRTLLGAAGAGGDNPHVAHDMPGMPTAADLRALEGLRERAFDRRTGELLRAYLEQLVLIANGERASGGAAEARELAADLVREHTAELAELDRAVAA